MKTSNGDAKHCSFLWALYAMSDTMQLDDSKQNWRGTKLWQNDHHIKLLLYTDDVTGMIYKSGYSYVGFKSSMYTVTTQ